MFVIYQCGCIGVPFDGKDAFIVRACDSERDAPRDSLSWFTRDMSGKQFTAVDTRVERTIHEQLAVRLTMADRFDDVQRALGIPTGGAVMAQKFIARERFEFPNGAIGWRPGGPFDCLGPYAKVQNCPVADTSVRLTCYATGYADTFFSVPACTRYRGKNIGGFFTMKDDAIEFVPTMKYAHLFHFNDDEARRQR